MLVRFLDRSESLVLFYIQPSSDESDPRLYVSRGKEELHSVDPKDISALNEEVGSSLAALRAYLARQSSDVES